MTLFLDLCFNPGTARVGAGEFSMSYPPLSSVSCMSHLICMVDITYLPFF